MLRSGTERTPHGISSAELLSRWEFQRGWSDQDEWLHDAASRPISPQSSLAFIALAGSLPIIPLLATAERAADPNTHAIAFADMTSAAQNGTRVTTTVTETHDDPNATVVTNALFRPIQRLCSSNTASPGSE